MDKKTFLTTTYNDLRASCFQIDSIRKNIYQANYLEDDFKSELSEAISTLTADILEAMNLIWNQINTEGLN